jgi:hypothetical protein
MKYIDITTGCMVFTVLFASFAKGLSPTDS